MVIKKGFFTIAFLVVSVLVIAQDKAVADKKLKQGHYYSALEIYKKVYETDSENTDLNFSMGVCYFNLKVYDKSEEHFLKSSSQSSLELFRYKAAVAHAMMKFKKATNFYNAYKLIAGTKELTNEQINHQIEKVKYAELAIAAPRNVIIQSFTEINSAKEEFTPHIIADETNLIFSSSNTEGKKDANGEPQSLIFTTEKINNSWEQAKILRDGVNIVGNNKVVGLSTDGQTMFIEREGDIYESKMGINGWEDPIKLDENINSKYNESGITITLDDKVMYFVSDRPGGFGGKDLYKVLRLPNGSWSKALNLGPSVNTEYDEEAPFIHTDKVTLYFSSKGHQNMGGYDVFKSVLENRIWSTPENLKCPINTVDDDLYYTLIASGKVAYLSGIRPEGKGGNDIYKIVLKDEFQQFHVIKGVVKGNSNPITAKITLIENESKKVHGIYKSNIKTGKFIMPIDPDKTYNIIVESEGFHSYTSTLVFDVNNDDMQEFALDAK